MTGPPRRRFEPLPDDVGPSTRLLHGARRPEPGAGAVVPPIYQSSTFHFPAAFSEAVDGPPYLYSRHANPTNEVAAALVAAAEGAETARVFASGMGALATVVLGVVRNGDEVVALESLYGGTLDLLGELLPRLGVRVRWVSDDAAGAPETCVGPATRLVVLESPTNPTLRVHDLARWAEAAHRVGARLAVDNTFATPINQRPLALGADLVVHSGTKYLGGHSDLLAGVVAGSAAQLDALEGTRTVLGAPLDPFAGFLLTRGLRTLALRVERQNATGRRIASELAEHPAVRAVHYPGRACEAEEAIARRQMTGRGGMVGLVVAGGAEAARRFLHRLRWFHVAPSLGGVESLASVPSETSHAGLSADELARRGIEPGLVRLSIGIEDADDLLTDLTRALGGG